MMAMDMLNTPPKRIKIARYPVKFFARSAQTLLNSVSLAGTTTQPLIAARPESEDRKDHNAETTIRTTSLLSSTIFRILYRS